MAAAIAAIAFFFFVPQNVLLNSHSDEFPWRQIAEPFQFELSGLDLLAVGGQKQRLFGKKSSKTFTAAISFAYDNGGDGNSLFKTFGSFQ